MGETTTTTLSKLPYIKYLDELRSVIIVSLVTTVLAAFVFYFFSEQALNRITEPVTSLGYEFVVLGVTEAIITRLKLSLLLGFLAALPVILWQIARFILPALRGKEKRYFVTFLVVAFFMFIGGISFAFFGVYRVGVGFLLRFAGPELEPMLTISNYVSFTVRFCLPFGIVFEFPLVTFFLTKLGMISYAGMLRARKYAALFSIVVAALLTPTPDIFTCLVMAGPIYILYEVSVTVARLVERGKERARQKAAAGA